MFEIVVIEHVFFALFRRVFFFEQQYVFREALRDFTRCEIIFQRLCAHGNFLRFFMQSIERRFAIDKRVGMFIEIGRQRFGLALLSRVARFFRHFFQREIIFRVFEIEKRGDYKRGVIHRPARASARVDRREIFFFFFGAAAEITAFAFEIIEQARADGVEFFFRVFGSAKQEITIIVFIAQRGIGGHEHFF